VAKIKTKAEQCYCAFCKNPREIYSKRSLSLINYIQALGIGIIATFLIWHEFNPKGLVIVVFAMIVIESGILLRRRTDLPCPHCGFDPALYKRNASAACEQVKKHIEGRQDDPNVWLARRPPLTVSRRKKKNSTREIVV